MSTGIVDGTVDFVTVTTLPSPTQGVLYRADGVTPVLVNTPITAAQAATLVFKPTLNFNGTVNILFTVTDNLGLVSIPSTEVITVIAVNDPPLATPSPISSPEDSPVTIALTGTDVDGTVDFVTVITLPPAIQGVLYLADGVTPVLANTQLTAAQAATLKFVPALNFNGTVNIPFTVTDDMGLVSTPANEVLTITPVNDAPLVDLNSAATQSDSNINNAVTFTEGDVPVKVALIVADVNDIGENDISSMKIVLGAALDGAAEIITIGSKSFPSNVSSSDRKSVV